MYDYSTLPSLVLDQIFGYLDYKERIRAKVCRRWKNEIEFKAKRNDNLIFYIGVYPMNRKWIWSNNKRLIKIENSFKIKKLDFLRSSYTLNHFRRLKKISIFNSVTLFDDMEVERPNEHVNLFGECEELEVYGFRFEGRTVFKLNKLRVLVIAEVGCEHLQLNCPKLEVFICLCNIPEIDYRYANKLKHIECFDDCLNKSTVKFGSLAYLTLFSAGEPIKGDLLNYMPNLKKLILFSKTSKQQLNVLKRQKAYYGLNELKLFCAGFGDDAIIKQNWPDLVFGIDAYTIDDIFVHYTKLTEPITRNSFIDYNALFDKFKILPGDFFTKVRFIKSVRLGKVDSYKHLFEFLKNCPQLDTVRFSPSMISKPEFFDCLFLLTPFIRLLCIRDCKLDMSKLNLTFLLNLHLANVELESTYLPIQFMKKCYKMCKNLCSFKFIQINRLMLDTGFNVVVFKFDGLLNVSNMEGTFLEHFRSLEDVFNYLQTNRMIREHIVV